MRLVFRAFGNPAAKRVSLSGTEREIRLRRGHHLILIGGKDAPAKQALLRLAGDDGMAMRFFALGVGVLGAVEAQAGLAAGRVRPVAFEATVGKNGADVAVELEFFSRRGAQASQSEKDKAAREEMNQSPAFENVFPPYKRGLV